jgi:hypothetical protein
MQKGAMPVDNTLCIEPEVLWQRFSGTPSGEFSEA